MFSFVCINQALRPYAWDPSYTSGCCVCDGSVYNYHRQPLYNGSSASAVLCYECRTVCDDLCAEARALLDAAHPSLRASNTPQDWADRVPVTAQRIAFLRVLAEMGPIMRSDTARNRCSWCDLPICSEPIAWARWKDDRPVLARIPAIRPLHCLHEKCWAEVAKTIHDEHLAQCVDSCALWLPLLPEVCRLIAAFICQLPAVGVEAAAVRRCATWGDGRA